MQITKAVIQVVIDLFSLLSLLLRSRGRLAAENLFLRKQLAYYQERGIRPRTGHSTTPTRPGNPVLIETLEDLYARTERVRGLTHRFSIGHSTILLGDHDKLMKLIRAGRADGYVRVISRHIHRGLGKLADFLEEMFGPRFEMDESFDQKTVG